MTEIQIRCLMPQMKSSSFSFSSRVQLFREETVYKHVAGPFKLDFVTNMATSDGVQFVDEHKKRKTCDGSSPLTMAGVTRLQRRQCAPTSGGAS